MNKYRILIFTIIILCSGMISHANEIEISSDVLFKGEPVTITLEKAVDSIFITYRPNSQVVKEEILTADTPSKTFEWAPLEAGVVAIQAGSSAKNVSVRFKGISGSGIFIMILAGLLLFGGATYAFRLLMYGKPPSDFDADIQHRVDT